MTLTFALQNVNSCSTIYYLSPGQIWEKSDKKWLRNCRNADSGKEIKRKKEKTTQQQKGLPTLSADLKYTKATPTLQNTPDGWFEEGNNLIVGNIKGFIFYLCPMTLKIYRCHLLVIRSVRTKFDGHSWNGQSVSCLQGLTTMCSVWPRPLTPDLENQ